jgi:hypothetical protein
LSKRTKYNFGAYPGSGHTSNMLNGKCMSWLYHWVIEGVKFNSEFILEVVERNATRGIWKILTS